MATPTNAGPDRRVLFIVLACVLLPVVVTLASLVAAHWHPSSDTALEVLRIRDVGGRHTPLTGVQSRYGWDHPGPAMFWVLAPFYWLRGDTGILFGVGLLNAVAVAGAVIVAWRRGGQALTVIVGIGALLLERALGSNFLVDAWNPWIALVPFFAYVLLAWSIAERDFVALPWAVGVGSFLIQTHVGYAPLVLGIGTIAAVLAFAGPRPDASAHGWTFRRGAIVGVIVGVVVWLPPVVQELTGDPRNLSEIVSYFRHPTEPVIGLAMGWGIMGKELGVAWLTGNDVGTLGAVATASVIPALILLAAVLGLAVVAWRRREGAVARLAILLVAASGVGVLAGSRITGLPGSYLLRWWWVLGMLLWCSLAWSVWTLLAATATKPARVIALVGIGALSVFSIGAAIVAVPARVPLDRVSRVLGRLTPRVTALLQHNRTYLVTYANSSDIGAAGVGLYLALAEHGFHVKVLPAQAQPFSTWRVAHAGEVNGTITLADSDDVAHGWTPPPGAREVAHYDPLTAAQRARAIALAQQLHREVGDQWWAESAPSSAYGRQVLLQHGANPSEVRELQRLRAPGAAYTVYLS
jgi:hypothetical protein